MKKTILLITGMLVLSGAAMADCGACGEAADVQKKAAGEVKAATQCTAEKAACTKVKAACKAEKAACEKKAACEVKAKKCGADKASCTQKAACEVKAAKKCGADCGKPCCAAKGPKKSLGQKLMFWKK